MIYRLAALLVFVAACGFEPHGVNGNPDATDPDAVDATPIDAVDATPIDAIDAPLPIDACVPNPLGELCNNADDDCDLQIDETFTTLGDACDGPDGDACTEGTVVCNGTTAVCSDTTGTIAELCNGTDDDCDTATDEGFGVGTACDGNDGDACLEGTVMCATTTTTTCSDLTSTSVETCNTMDDDCDLQTDEDFDLTGDPANCGQCGRVCTNPFGTTTCAASTCTPTCATPGSHDCDGDPVSGCEARNTSPGCGSVTTLGSVSGDTGAQTLSATGYSERFLRVNITEDNTGSFSDLDAQITLTSPPGTDFDLYVYCAACSGTPLVSNNSTATDRVNIGRNDVAGTTNYSIIIEIRWFSSNACGNWSLLVEGNIDTSDNSCN